MFLVPHLFDTGYYLLVARYYCWILDNALMILVIQYFFKNLFEPLLSSIEYPVLFLYRSFHGFRDRFLFQFIKPIPGPRGHIPRFPRIT